MKTYRIGAKGFTLIELLLVMVILVVLSSIAVPSWQNQRKKASHAKAVADISNLATVINAFAIDCGRYPTTEEGLAILVQNSPALANWEGPYIELLPKDPWDHQYAYQCPGSHFPQSFDLYTYGPDGHAGGDDDIGNWQN